MKQGNLQRPAVPALLALGIAAIFAISGYAATALNEGDGSADREIAKLLVKLELKTRSVIAGHYAREQVGGEEQTAAYQRLMRRNLILPAAVADSIYASTVPESTGGRAWVKMIVDVPRNPNNKGDATSASILEELKGGASSVERKADGAVYYAEPIIARMDCLTCHGEPKGKPDPYFPQYHREGWTENQVIGAVMARVGM